MTIDDIFDSNPPKRNKHSRYNSPHKNTRISGFVEVYITLSIMGKMRHQLGVEAMLEYLEAYLKTIDKHNPRLKSTISRVLSMMDVEETYRQMLTR